MSTQPTAFLTPEQYLEIERRAEYKSEYYRGEMFAMSGAQRAHNTIAMNTYGQLYQQLRGGACQAYPSDMRVQVGETGLYTYPDAMVTCGEPRFADGHYDVLLNPIVLVEVLSPSTERSDRVFKLKLYQTIESLQHYLLIASEYMQTDLYTRQADGNWSHITSVRPEETVELQSAKCRLALADLYERVVFRNQPRQS